MSMIKIRAHARTHTYIKYIYKSLLPLIVLDWIGLLKVFVRHDASSMDVCS